MSGAAYVARPIRCRATKQEMADRADALVALAEQYGPCSVRQLYYRATVAKVPGITKTESGYNKVQRLVLDLRRSGGIPYGLITDSTRWVRKSDSFSGLDHALEATARLYRRDLWARSPYRLEVWAESDSIGSSVFEVTDQWDVPLMVCRGQPSETFAWAAAQAWVRTPRRTPVVVYIGDHDPAGLEIEQTLRRKLEGFAGDVVGEVGWVRVGVTWEQVEQFDLPGTPPKKTYGFPMSVEAEALPPDYLRSLVEQEIVRFVDRSELAQVRRIEAAEKAMAFEFARKWREAS